MRKLLAIVAVLAVAGCVKPEKRAALEVDLSKRLSPGCYTVDLFDPYQIEYPAANVPKEVRQFLGVWKNGAWGGRTCHDLYITQAFPDGRVTVIDAYGPDSNSGRDATVFTRTGIVSNGVLTFQSIGSAPVNYRMVGEFLVGERLDAFGKFEITMSREEALAEVPIPPVKPART